MSFLQSGIQSVFGGSAEESAKANAAREKEARILHPINPYNLDPNLFEEFANSASATGNIDAARATITGPEGPGGPPVYSPVIDAYRQWVANKKQSNETNSVYLAAKKTSPGRDQTIITEQSNQSTILGTPKTRTLLG